MAGNSAKMPFNAMAHNAVQSRITGVELFWYHLWQPLTTETHWNRDLLDQLFLSLTTISKLLMTINESLLTTLHWASIHFSVTCVILFIATSFMWKNNLGNYWMVSSLTGDLNVDISSSLESLCGSSPNLSCEPSNVLLCLPESTSSMSSPPLSPAASRFISSNICCSNDCDSSSSAAWYFPKMYGFSPYSPPNKNNPFKGPLLGITWVSS